MSDRKLPLADATERRTFLKQVAGAAGAASLPAASAVAQNAPATAPAVPAGYLSLSPDEAAFTEAMVNVMCPADEFTRNGVDCGLATFIDRQLAGEFGKGVRRYMRGPFAEAKPQLGYQLPLTPEQLYKAGVEAANQACLKKHRALFDQLSAADADAFLRAIAANQISDARVSLASWFNDLVYPLFTQACFADPIYGGNADKVFWKMIGYPGLPATHALNIVQYRGKEFPGAKNPKSIADFS